MNDLFNNEVNNYNGDNNSRESVYSVSDQDSGHQTESEDFVTEDLVNLINLETVSQLSPS